MPNATSISLEHERSFGKDAIVMGIDEAGRGPLAGPVFAAAVSVKSLNDAARLTCSRTNGRP